MRLRMFTILAAVAIVAVASWALPASTFGNQHGHGDASHEKSDPISGEWNGTLRVAGHTEPFTLKLKLDGKKVTGEANSNHTGPGTLSDGSWADNKLNFTMNFASHESILVSGAMKDGKLAGEFRTEGRVGTWEASKK